MSELPYKSFASLFISLSESSACIERSFLSFSQYEFGILGENSSDNGVIGIAWMLHPRISELICSAKEACDYLILLPHAGLECFQYPLPEIKELYRHFISLGADAIIASHTHIPQCWEYYNRKPIVYSLGNFCFDDDSSEEFWYIGLCASLKIEKCKIDLNIEVINYDRKTGVVEIDNNKEYYNSLLKKNEIFQDSDSYLRLVNEKCLQLKKTYDNLFEMSGLIKPSFFRYLRLLMGIVKRKVLFMAPQSFDDSHYINNIRCETHRWVLCRIYNLSNDRYY